MFFGKAFEKICPDKKITVEYQLTNSMFCTIDDSDVTEEIVENLSNEMREIVNKDLKIKQVIMTREEAKAFYEKIMYQKEDYNMI